MPECPACKGTGTDTITLFDDNLNVVDKDEVSCCICGGDGNV